MKITIKTSLIKVVIKDEPTFDYKGYTKRSVPELQDFYKEAIAKAIRLHNEIK